MWAMAAIAPPPVTIRAARPADAAADRRALQRRASPSARRRSRRARASADEIARLVRAGLPFLRRRRTATARVVGFARVSPYSDRCVYAGVGEHGVYVDADGARPGASAGACSTRSADAAERRGLLQAHEPDLHDQRREPRRPPRGRASSEVGVQRRHGRLDGEWKDCVLVERLLGEAADGASQREAGRRR